MQSTFSSRARLLLLALALAGTSLLVLACQGGKPLFFNNTGPDGTPFTGLSTALPPAADPALGVMLPETMPRVLADPVLRWIAAQPDGRVVTNTQVADLWIDTLPDGDLLAERVYVPVARFATVQDDVDAVQLLALWMNTPKTADETLAVTADAVAGLTALWGEPMQVEVFTSTLTLTQALEAAPGRLGIVPFDQLAPELKALKVGAQDPTDNTFDAAEYPLALRLYLHAKPGAEELAASLLAAVQAAMPQTNRDPARLTILTMTGVTAMARVTALRMEEMGVDYPAEVVGPVLAASDITHISNEIPFVEDCQVNASENNLTLCSSPKYLQALRDVGVDIVGLTGNHLNDFGPADNLWSLQFYAQEKLPTYGGGANLAEALKPLLVEHNGNRLAFLGANEFGPTQAWATATDAGSAPYDLKQLRTAIAAARTELNADLVLVELQWTESYDIMPLPEQREQMQALSAAGADIVTGVQSHVAQTFGFGDGGLVLYGLGNFFFDQMWSQETREAIIARHTIYDGRHVSTTLLTTLLEDYAQPRWMDEDERADLLERLFTAGGW
ncbi:MAG: CapA family protein [Anaerolineae bacterium]